MGKSNWICVCDTCPSSHNVLCECIDQLVSIIVQEQGYSIQEITEEYDELEERSPSQEKDGVVKIRGSLISFVDRLDDEFTRSLQNIDPHGTEYVDRLKDEKGLYYTICRTQALYEKKGHDEPLGRVIMRRLEHIYSKVSITMSACVCCSSLFPSPMLLFKLSS